jgi:hypothetical protein
MKDLTKSKVIGVMAFFTMTIILFTLYCNFMFSDLERRNFILPYVYEVQVQNSPAINIIYEKCKDEFNKTECVFDSIPFDFETSRAANDRWSVDIKQPEQQLSEGMGICRDIAVFRHLVLNKLEVENHYVFEPNHVYVVSRENYHYYVLNNQYLTTL